MTKNTRIYSYDQLKFLAITFMVIDHLGVFFFQDQLIFREIGRFAAPIFFYLIGFSKSTKIDKPLILSAIIFQLIVSFETQNYLPKILFTIILLRIFNNYLNRFSPNFFNLTLLLILSLTLFPITQYIFEYGTISIFFAISGKLKKEKHLYFMPFLTISTITHLIIQYYQFNFSPTAIITFISIIILIPLTKRLPKLKLIQTISTHSLKIYILHYLLFLYLSKII